MVRRNEPIGSETGSFQHDLACALASPLERSPTSDADASLSFDWDEDVIESAANLAVAVIHAEKTIAQSDNQGKTFGHLLGDASTAGLPCLHPADTKIAQGESINSRESLAALQEAAKRVIASSGAGRSHSKPTARDDEQDKVEQALETYVHATELADGSQAVAAARFVL